MLIQKLNQFKWFRRLRGGIWWETIRYDQCDYHLWVNICPQDINTVLNSEDYTQANAHTLNDIEFYTAVANIPRNGEWKDDSNLSKYLKAARLLRGRGLEDTLILHMLTKLNVAAHIECNADLPKRSHEWDEILNILNH